jgi:hypothetical protein
MGRTATRPGSAAEGGCGVTEIPQAVTIREVGPRDGLQLEQPLAFEQKLELIEALARTGLGDAGGRCEVINLVRAGGRSWPVARRVG